MHTQVLELEPWAVHNEGVFVNLCWRQLFESDLGEKTENFGGCEFSVSRSRFR